MPNSYLIPDPALRAHTARVEVLSRALRNEDSYAIDLAAKALLDGTPAYWHGAGARLANTGLLVLYVNGNGVLDGFAQYRKDYPHSDRKLTIAQLDKLVPLNEAAVANLGLAYDALNTFRDRAELARREDKIVPPSLDVLAARNRAALADLDASIIENGAKADAAIERMRAVA